MKDITVEKIREIRHKISEECGHDPKKLVKHYIDLQKKYKNRLIRKSTNIVGVK